MPYTATEKTILKNLIKKHGDSKGYDIFNKMRAQGDLGEDSKNRMERRAAESKRTGKAHNWRSEL
jgi:hypothetical protein